MTKKDIEKLILWNESLALDLEASVKHDKEAAKFIEPLIRAYKEQAKRYKWLLKEGKYE